jgi:hypothetical protein
MLQGTGSWIFDDETESLVQEAAAQAANSLVQQLREALFLVRANRA